MRRLVAALLLVASSSLAADRDPARYERLLLPFTGFTFGAGGAWTAEWWFRNDGDTPVDVFPLARVCGLCPPSFRYSVGTTIAPRTTPMFIPGDVLPGPQFPLAIVIASAPPGVFLYVERDKSAQLAITGFLGRSTFKGFQSRSVGSALQPVPESRFRSGRQSIFLPSIAADARYALRVYATPESVDTPAVTVRAFAVSELAGPPFQDESALGTATFGLVTPDSQDFRSQCTAPCAVPVVPYKPAVAELPLGALLGSPRDGAVRIEIEPASSKVRWWAVISATNNSTDQVQLFPLADF